MLLLVQLQADKAVALLSGNVKKVAVKSVVDQLASVPHIQCQVWIISFKCLDCTISISFHWFGCVQYLKLVLKNHHEYGAQFGKLQVSRFILLTAIVLFLYCLKHTWHSIWGAFNHTVSFQVKLMADFCRSELLEFLHENVCMIIHWLIAQFLLYESLGIIFTFAFRLCRSKTRKKCASSECCGAS